MISFWMKYQIYQLFFLWFSIKLIKNSWNKWKIYSYFICAAEKNNERIWKNKQRRDANKIGPSMLFLSLDNHFLTIDFLFYYWLNIYVPHIRLNWSHPKLVASKYYILADRRHPIVWTYSISCQTLEYPYSLIQNSIENS